MKVLFNIYQPNNVSVLQFQDLLPKYTKLNRTCHHQLLYLFQTVCLCEYEFELTVCVFASVCMVKKDVYVSNTIITAQ